MKYYKDNKFINFTKIKLDILNEKTKQLEKWGIKSHTLLEWVMILNEEVGELNKEVLQNHYGKDNMNEIIEELIQTITVSINILDLLYTGYTGGLKSKD